MRNKFDNNDFGFSLAYEKDIVAVYPDSKAERISKLIMPLLRNFSEHPERNVIKWTGAVRVKAAKKMIEQINSILVDNKG